MGQAQRRWLRRFPAKAPLRPRAPARSESKASNRLQLNGTAVGNGSSYAVINGEILTEGESVNGSTIIGITKEEVVLKQQDGKKITLRLQES